MQLFRAFARASGAVAVLLSSGTAPGSGRGCVVPHPLGARYGGQAGSRRRGLFAEPSRYQDHRARRAVRRPADDAAHVRRRRRTAPPSPASTTPGCPTSPRTSWSQRCPRRSPARSPRPTGRPASIGAASINGTLYGIPNEIDVYALNYNKKLFEAAGIAEAPKTWDEFLAAAEKLTDKSKGQQGFGLINSWAAGVLHPFSSLLVSNGGDLVVDGKPVLDSEAGPADLRALREADQVGLFRPRRWPRPTPIPPARSSTASCPARPA